MAELQPSDLEPATPGPKIAPLDPKLAPLDPKLAPLDPKLAPLDPVEPAPMTLADFVELVQQQLVAALERSRAGLDQRTLAAAAIAWSRRPSSGIELDPIALVHAIVRAIVRARGVDPDPHHARLAAAASLAYIATELERDPERGPWSLAKPAARRACARELLVMAGRLAQGEARCAELIEAHAELIGELDSTAATRPAALGLVCATAALAAGGDDEQVDAFAIAGEATAEIAWWLDELRQLLQPLDRAGVEARRRGPVLRLFAEHSSFDQRETLTELVEALPQASASLHELLLTSGLVGRCAEVIEGARREVHEQLASQAAPDGDDSGRACAGLRNWLVAVDQLAAHLYRVPELSCSASVRSPAGPWTRLVAASLTELGERLGQSGPSGPGRSLPELRLRAWGQPAWRWDPGLAVVLYPDLDGQPEALLEPFAERLATDPEEVTALLEGLAPLFVVHEAARAWLDALGPQQGDDAAAAQPWAQTWAAARLSVAYLQRFEPAVLALAQRVADHALAGPEPALGPAERAEIEAAIDADDPRGPNELLDRLADRQRSPAAPLVELAAIRELMLRRLDLDEELDRLLPTAGDPSPRAANQAPGGGPATGPAGPSRPSRARAWASGISAACEQGLIALCPTGPWRRSMRAVLSRADLRRGRIDLWAELADELGFELTEGSLRGAVNYVQACSFGLVDDLRRGQTRDLDPREAPIIQATLAQLAAHLDDYCEIDLEDRSEAARLLGEAHAALWRDTRGETVDAHGWWALAEGLAGEQLAAYLVRFGSGVIGSERAATLGRRLGVLAHLGAALAQDDPRLLRLGPATVSSLTERAVARAQPLLDPCTPAAVRRRGQAWIARLRGSL